MSEALFIFVAFNIILAVYNFRKTYTFRITKKAQDDKISSQEKLLKQKNDKINELTSSLSNSSVIKDIMILDNVEIVYLEQIIEKRSRGINDTFVEINYSGKKEEVNLNMQGIEFVKSLASKDIICITNQNIERSKAILAHSGLENIIKILVKKPVEIYDDQEVLFRK